MKEIRIKPFNNILCFNRDAYIMFNHQLCKSYSIHQNNIIPVFCIFYRIVRKARCRNK